jgi:IS6 family transposase
MTLGRSAARPLGRGIYGVSPSYAPSAATAEMKYDGEMWRRSRLRQVKYLNNIIEQDHGRIKRLTRPRFGFGGLWTAR